MTNEARSGLLTPEQVAAELGLHVKTARRYIREGRLPSVRVGKRYRVPRGALEALTRVESNESPEPAPFADASTIVTIDRLDPATAESLTHQILAGVKGRDARDSRLRIDSIYQPDQRRLKLVISGSPSSTSVILSWVDVLVRERT